VKGYIRSSYGRRVYFDDPRGCFVSVPETFTDLVPPEPFVALSAGRCFCRTEDLVELVRIVQGAIERQRANV